jgi:leader peptidase (prepilin peptidase)/N-methyltransferase
VVAPVWFFLAGLPAAVLIGRLIARFEADDEAEAPDADGPAALPWQRGPWQLRVRASIASLAPLLMALAGWRFDPAQAAAVSLLLAALLVCAGTDLTAFRVPNAVTYPGTALALLGALILPGGDALGGLAAAAAGGGLFLIISMATRGGIGIGDAKLAALIGAALGFPASYQAIVIGVVAGGVAILLLLVAGVVGRKQAVPYAPFLALAAAAVVLAEGAAFAPL